MKSFAGHIAAALLLLAGAAGCNRQAQPLPSAVVISCSVNGSGVADGGKTGGIAADDVTICLEFSTDVDVTLLDEDKLFMSNLGHYSASQTAPDAICITPDGPLEPSSTYYIYVVKGDNLGVHLVRDYIFGFTTAMEETTAFPKIPSDELLTLVQERTFAYFWDYAHPVSGLARERLGSGETVTAGGSGFGYRKNYII